MTLPTAISTVRRLTDECRDLLAAANAAKTERARNTSLRRFLRVNARRVELVERFGLVEYAAGLVG